MNSARLLKKAILLSLIVFSLYPNFAEAKSESITTSVFAPPPPPPCGFSMSFTGDTVLCSGSSITYRTKQESGITYTWVVSGGTIIAGQGSDTLVVNWPNGVHGSIKLYKESSTCKDSVMSNVTVAASNPVLSKKNNYSLVGNATMSGSTITLTNNSSDQNSAAWNNSAINLKYSFDFTFNVYQCGTADGMMFILQNSGTKAMGGSTKQGSAMAYYDGDKGVMDQSLGIELDIYKSGTGWSDTSGSHIALVANKSTIPLIKQVDINPALASCANKKFRVVWNSTNHQLTVYYAGSKVFTYTNDIVSKIFGGDPNVYFGFTAATGGLTATQQFSNDTLIYNKPSVSVKGGLSFCEGDSTILTVTTPGRAFKWSSGDTGKVLYVTQSGDYNVIVTDSTGCDRVSDAFRIRVNPMPTVELGEGDTVCQGEKVGLGVLPNSSFVYSWTSSPAGFSSFRSMDTVKPTQTTTYYLKVTSRSGSCSVVDSVTIYVRKPPTISFSLGSACAGEPISVVNSSTSGSGGKLSYLWRFSDSTMATDETPIKSFDKGGTYTVWLIATDDSTGCMDSSSKTVTVYPRPSINFTAASACFGNTISFKNLSSINVGYISNTLWDFGDGTTSTLTNPTKKYDKEGTYTVWLICTSARGCKDSSSQQVTVYPKPHSSFTFIDGCISGGPVHFSNTSTVDTGYTIKSYLWDFGDNNKSFTESPDHAYQKAGEYKVSLIITSNTGCTDTTTDTVRIYALPKADIETEYVCLGSPVHFKDHSTVSAPDSIQSWQWDFGDGNTSTERNPQHTYAKAGKYTVRCKITTTHSCPDSTSTLATVYDVPSAKFTYSATGRKVSFTASDSTGPGYHWDFGDGTTSTDRDPVKLYSKAGHYEVKLKVTNDDGCTAEYSDSVGTTVSIARLNPAALNLKLYPNPANHIFHLSYTLAATEQVQLSLYALDGRMLGTLVKGKQEAGSYEYSINPADYGISAGVYQLKIQVGTQTLNQKVILLK